MLPVLVFDVNGTLLDTGALADELAMLFGKGVTVREWFVEVLQHTLVLTSSGDYADMGEVATAVLRMTAVRQGRKLEESEIEAVKRRLMSLPPFPDVKGALDQLQAAGFRLAALTNSSAEGLEKQLAQAGLTGYFEQAISVDRVRRYKPAPEVYRSAAEALEIRMSDLLMVAAHGWDVYGAMRAGCRAAFIARSGQAVFPMGRAPDFFARDLEEFARAMTEQVS